VVEATVVQLRLAKLGRTTAEQAAYDDAISKYEKVSAEKIAKRDELKQTAEQDQKTMTRSIIGTISLICRVPYWRSRLPCSR